MESQDVVLPNDYPGDTASAYPHACYVYFIYSAGRVKIGRAVDVAARVSQIANGSPFRPALIYSIGGPRALEAELHARFAEDRVHREWFRLSDHLRRYLNGRLDEQGKAAFLQAERDFVKALSPVPPDVGTRKWKKPPKRCHHRNPLSKSCSKCNREADLRVYEELTRRLEQ